MQANRHARGAADTVSIMVVIQGCNIKDGHPSPLRSMQAVRICRKRQLLGRPLPRWSPRPPRHFRKRAFCAENCNAVADEAVVPLKRCKRLAPKVEAVEARVLYRLPENSPSSTFSVEIGRQGCEDIAERSETC